ncbi:MAG: radical SAM protein [Desulfobacteraceae bacterium]|nr:MAG: radical SAM protein [Desulfobacteraceae bacterium]
MKEKRYFVKKDLGSHILWKGEGPPAAHLDIELTERCNNNCIHCSINLPAGDGNNRSREHDTEGWKKILRQAGDLGIMTVRFTGGEPLLRNDFSELYLFARRLGLTVLLFTNARLITPQIADMLADIPPLEDIEISVYGMKKESYEAVTGTPGSYEEFRNGMQSLIDRKIPFVVKGALLPPNKKEMAEFAAWAAANPRMDAPPAYAMFFDLRGRRDSAAKNSRIRRLRVSPEEGLEVLTQQPEHYRRELSEFFDKFLSPPGDRLFTCGIGPGCVDAYGVFQPCLSLRHPDLTFDLKKGTLKEALTSVFPRLKEMRAINRLYLERCARCFLRGFCEQCPAKSWSEHGTLDTPVEYFCRVAHAQARFLGLVRKGEQAWKVRDREERIKDLLQKSR